MVSAFHVQLIKAHKQYRETFAANYSIAQTLAMEPRVRNAPTDARPIAGSHRCRELPRQGALLGPAGLGGLGGLCWGRSWLAGCALPGRGAQRRLKAPRVGEAAETLTDGLGEVLTRD